MNILFYLNNQEETAIATMYDLESNPFKVDDIISLTVNEIHPDTTKYNSEFRDNMIKNNIELERMFTNKKIRLVRENKSMIFSSIQDARLTIEYHCEYVEN